MNRAPTCRPGQNPACLIARTRDCYHSGRYQGIRDAHPIREMAPLEATVRFGLILTNQHPPGSPLGERFKDTIEQVRLARDLGFDLITFGKLSLLNELGAMQPAIAAARLAAETGTMRLGITIYLLPLLNPVAIAEEAASLDIVTGGRFIFGIGLGYREAEDNAFGLLPGERVTKLRSHLDVIKKLWTGQPVDFESNACTLRGATMALRPIQQPHPPVWVA